LNLAKPFSKLEALTPTNQIIRQLANAESFVAHFPASSEFPRREGLAGVGMGITRVRTAFPDWFEHVEDVIHAGDRVVTRYTSTGTHQADSPTTI
jgi:hypothetical protein